MKGKCVIVTNSLSGGYRSVRGRDLLDVFGDGYETEVFSIAENRPFAYVPADRIVVCGGDGTLNSVINMYRGNDAEIIYCPYGTLNETSKRALKEGGENVLTDCGTVNGRYFSYVFAAGTFTPLGYTGKARTKQRMHVFAYVLNVFKELKVRRMAAEISLDGERHSGEYSLIMAINSPQCFGLRFNRMFELNGGKLCALLIRAPRFNGFPGLCEMFFPFFRAFFVGFGKPYESRRMIFREVRSMDVETAAPEDFCADGEKWTMSGRLEIRPAELVPPVRVMSAGAVSEAAERKRREREK